MRLRHRFALAGMVPVFAAIFFMIGSIHSVYAADGLKTPGGGYMPAVPVPTSSPSPSSQPAAPPPKPVIVWQSPTVGGWALAIDKAPGSPPGVVIYKPAAPAPAPAPTPSPSPSPSASMLPGQRAQLANDVAGMISGKYDGAFNGQK